ncbi:MAG: hypothetical protein ACRDTG_08005 [Pseudonocardiaceae bacterium]
MAAGGERVTWRCELPGAWGGRLDPAWLPTGGQESWRRVFEGEDLAARMFSVGGAGLHWAQLVEAAAALAGTLAEYRMQWYVAEQIAAGCSTGADRHLVALVVDPVLCPPRRSHPGGRWRLCGLVDGSPVTLDEFDAADLAEGCAVAHRAGAPARAYWAEPVAAGPAAPPGAGDQGWTPVVDTALRLVAFAAEESVATLCATAATGHTGPDVLSRRLLCKLGLVTHRMILEYRTLFRAAWTDMDACGLSAAHDADAEARLTTVPQPTADGPGGPWRHALLAEGCAGEVSVHAGLPAAAASVAAQRGVDGDSIRWAEPVAAAPRRTLH